MLGAKELIDFKTKRNQGRYPFPPTGDINTTPPTFPPWFRPVPTDSNPKLQNEKPRVGFGRTEVSVHQTKALRELFRMGMVSGFLVFKGSQIWAAWSIRFQQFGPFLTVFMKRLNGKGPISVSRAESDTK